MFRYSFDGYSQVLINVRHRENTSVPEPEDTPFMQRNPPCGIRILDTHCFAPSLWPSLLAHAVKPAGEFTLGSKAEAAAACWSSAESGADGSSAKSGIRDQ